MCQKVISMVSPCFLCLISLLILVKRWRATWCWGNLKYAYKIVMLYLLQFLLSCWPDPLWRLFFICINKEYIKVTLPAPASPCDRNVPSGFKWQDISHDIRCIWHIFWQIEGQGGIYNRLNNRDHFFLQLPEILFWHNRDNHNVKAWGQDRALTRHLIAPSPHKKLPLSLTDPEARSGERVGPLPVLRDQRGVVALLAGILALPLQADPLADERSDDHLEALACGGALRAPHQPVDAQPDDKQMGDQRGHPGILSLPSTETPGHLITSRGFQLQLKGAYFVNTEGNFWRLIRWRKKNKNVCPPSCFLLWEK